MTLDYPVYQLVTINSAWSHVEVEEAMFLIQTDMVAVPSLGGATAIYQAVQILKRVGNIYPRGVTHHPRRIMKYFLRIISILQHPNNCPVIWGQKKNV